MALTPREYLIDRFQGDAVALRARVTALQSGAALPGPDVVTSTRMAEACDAVVAMLNGMSPHETLAAELTWLSTLVPLLEQRARASEQAPPVRAVFAGAATRIREVVTAETQAQPSAAPGESDA